MNKLLPTHFVCIPKRTCIGGKDDGKAVCTTHQCVFCQVICSCSSIVLYLFIQLIQMCITRLKYSYKFQKYSYVQRILRKKFYHINKIIDIANGKMNFVVKLNLCNLHTCKSLLKIDSIYLHHCLY